MEPCGSEAGLVPRTVHDVLEKRNLSSCREMEFDFLVQGLGIGLNRPGVIVGFN